MLKTKAGISVPTVDPAILAEIRLSMQQEFGISTAAVIESCAFSFAMIVRFALGLSTTGARSACIVNDTLAGCVALATSRQLINAGADVELIFAGSLDNVSQEIEQQLNILGAYGLPLTVWSDPNDSSNIADILGYCHNSMLGLNSIAGLKSEDIDFVKSINNLLNEQSTPIYAAEFPTQVDMKTGKSLGTPLYASATVTFGLPVLGAEFAEDYVGRLYVCDSLIPKPLYEKYGFNCQELFSEQPVQQLLFG